MELAWLLSGLANLSLACGKNIDGLEKAALRVSSSLLIHYGQRGIFGHGGVNFLMRAIRGRIGSFADQIYPIYALSQFYKAYGLSIAKRVAAECAETICQSQGTLGQWWWQYDMSTGKVIGRYPVFSVHQNGMAPMALLSVQEITEGDYIKSIQKGLRWLKSENEIGCDFICTNEHLIWRKLHRSLVNTYLEEMLTLIGYKQNSIRPTDLNVLYECRPYHLGWLLYALVGQNISIKD